MTGVFSLNWDLSITDTKWPHWTTCTVFSKQNNSPVLPDARKCSKFWHSDCLYKDLIHLTTVTVIQITVNFSLPQLRCSWLYSIKQLHVYSSCLHFVDYVFMFLFWSPPYNCFFSALFFLCFVSCFLLRMFWSHQPKVIVIEQVLYIYFTHAISIMYWSYCSCFKQ